MYMDHKAIWDMEPGVWGAFVHAKIKAGNGHGLCNSDHRKFYQIDIMTEGLCTTLSVL
jgi:hypothetical protein